MKTKYSRFVFSIFTLFFIIIDPKTGSQSAYEAINMCIKSVIPSIFPFLILGNFIASDLCSCSIPYMDSMLRIPKKTSGYFLLSLVCGYPVGAGLLQKAYDSNFLSKQDLQRMVCFCNNASPAFIIGILSSIVGLRASVFMWVIQALSSLMLGILLPNEAMNQQNEKGLNIDKSGSFMSASVITMANICGWVIAFKIIIAYLYKLLPLKGLFYALLTGVLELTNGIFALSELRSLRAIYTIAAFMLSFGGICVVIQTKSIAPTISIRKLLTGRLLHAGISCTLASIATPILFTPHKMQIPLLPLFLCVVTVGYMLLVFNKKSGSNQCESVV